MTSQFPTDSKRARIASAFSRPESVASTLQPPAGTSQNSSGAGVQRAPPPAGSWPTVDGYEILAELGRGNMGVVYKARQINLNRLVALKMVRVGAHAGRTELKRFMAEAQVVAGLQHPNFVQVYQIGVQNGLPFFSMELIEGGNLKDKLAGKPLPPRDAARLICTLAQAMGYAHRNGIVHRDLKPANILLCQAGSRETRILRLRDADPRAVNLSMPKITDFGLAKQLQQDGGQTESGMVMGTPNYMAPEQAEGRSHAVGPPADVYALGAILYELFTGHPPYNSASPAETILQIFRAEPIPPSRLQAQVPRDLETICMKCLQKDPRRRYVNAQQLADDLERYLASEPISARPASVLERSWKWMRRHPAMATLTGCAILALASLAGLSLAHQIDLQARLVQARAEERRARLAEEAASARTRTAELRSQVKELLNAGEHAVAGGDWNTAQMQWLLARDKIGAAPELAELQPVVDRLLDQANHQVTDRDRYRKFLKLRDEALFHASLFTGTDLASSLKKTRTAVMDGLALYGISLESGDRPALGGSVLRPDEQAEVVAGCYELLLVLADAVAQPLPGQAEEQIEEQAREALAILKRAAGFGPATRAFHLRRAQYLTQSGERQLAREERERAKRLQPADVMDYFLVGNEEYRQGRLTEAIKHLEKALQLQPEHFWAQYYLGLCRLKTGRPDLATMAFTACLGRQPDFAWLYLLRGSAWAERGEFAGAEADFRDALKRPLDKAGRYGLLVNRGVLHLRQGRLGEAAADFQQAITLQPGLYQAHANLAQVFIKQEKLGEAIACLDRAIEREPGWAPLYRTRARLHLQRPDHAAALRDLDKAIALAGAAPAPAVADDYLDRGRLLHRAGNSTSALYDCEAALKMRPKNVPAHLLRAEILIELNRLPEALRSLDAAVAAGPADAAVFRSRAALHARLAQYPQALADYTKALELQPDAATYAARGWAFLVTDARQLALPDFERAIRLKPKLGDAYAGRGFVRVLQGKVSEGIHDADEALRHGPLSPRLVYNVARIYAQAARMTEKRYSESYRYQEQAVALLQKALDLVPPAERAAFWTKYVRPDTAFNPVHAHFRFRQLAARVPRPAAESAGQ
jgi:eukaryotic-like serine/threonine-protein kinase